MRNLFAMKNSNNKYILLSLAFLLMNFIALGQPTPGGGAAPAAVPIDGGLTLLAAAGIGIGARKYLKNRKK